METASHGRGHKILSYPAGLTPTASSRDQLPRRRRALQVHRLRARLFPFVKLHDRTARQARVRLRSRVEEDAAAPLLRPAVRLERERGRQVRVGSWWGRFRHGGEFSGAPARTGAGRGSEGSRTRGGGRRSVAGVRTSAAAVRRCESAAAGASCASPTKTTQATPAVHRRVPGARGRTR